MADDSCNTKALSRARHKGNVPTLPQTKSCPICPGKFTRINHLQRHLLSHTNERSHKCESCNAEFTRRDLLTRHYRTCAGTSTPRSRRKSCEACAEGKIKCDLQVPCSACTSRGKACEYRNNPNISRTKPKGVRISPSDNSGSDREQALVSTSELLTEPVEAAVALRLPDEFDDSHSVMSNIFSFPDGLSDAFFTDLAILGQASNFTPLANPSPTVFPKKSLAASASELFTESELNHFVHLFFETFSTQLPVVHRGTWRSEDKPPILVRSMQACGALFVKTRKAGKFVSETITLVRDVIVEEIAATAGNPMLQDYLVLAIVLLQTIGLHHEDKAHRDSSSLWHGMLVMIIRHTRSIERSRNWAPPARLDDFKSIEAAWRNWGFYETIKRGLLLAHLLDCSHCVLFSGMPSTFQPVEFDMTAPCDESLWKASTASEWYALLSMAPPYNALSGVHMRHALHALQQLPADFDNPSDILLLNKFTLFILIHEVLRRLYSQLHNYTSTPWSSDPLSHALFFPEFTRILHNWAQMWMKNINNSHLAKDDGNLGELPFVFDALPYYWLSHVTFWALHSQSAGWIGSMTPQNRFFVINEWLRRIRLFLKSNNNTPPDLAKEFKIIYQQVGEVEFRFSLGQCGLLSFFPEC